jgi:hypothetical protein
MPRQAKPKMRRYRPAINCAATFLRLKRIQPVVGKLAEILVRSAGADLNQSWRPQSLSGSISGAQ